MNFAILAYAIRKLRARHRAGVDKCAPKPASAKVASATLCALTAGTPTTQAVPRTNFAHSAYATPSETITLNVATPGSASQAHALQLGALMRTANPRRDLK